MSGPELSVACPATGAWTTVSFVACYYNISWNAEFICLSAAVRRKATGIYAGSDTVDRDRVREYSSMLVMISLRGFPSFHAKWRRRRRTNGRTASIRAQKTSTATERSTNECRWPDASLLLVFKTMTLNDKANLFVPIFCSVPWAPLHCRKVFR